MDKQEKFEREELSSPKHIVSNAIYDTIIDRLSNTYHKVNGDGIYIAIIGEGHEILREKKWEFGYISTDFKIGDIKIKCYKFHKPKYNDNVSLEAKEILLRDILGDYKQITKDEFYKNTKDIMDDLGIVLNKL